LSRQKFARSAEDKNIMATRAGDFLKRFTRRRSSASTSTRGAAHHQAELHIINKARSSYARTVRGRDALIINPVSA
jgi:hypothetical protein